jgi:hypothetical protein
MVSNGSVCIVDCVVGINADGLRVDLDSSHILLALEQLIGLSLQLLSFLQALRRGRGFIGRILGAKKKKKKKTI